MHMEEELTQVSFWMVQMIDQICWALSRKVESCKRVYVHGVYWWDVRIRLTAASWVPEEWGRAGLDRGIYASPVFSVREVGLNEEKPSSSGKRIAIRLSGQTPVALKLLIMFGMENDLYQAFANTSQKSYWYTVRPGLEAQNVWQISLHAAFKGAKHPISRRWVVWGGRAQRITIWMVSGQ